MKRKYEFTGFTSNGYKQIVRLSDGLVGGFIESEDNLSHIGDCFVYDTATVIDQATVRDNAIISGRACLSNQSSARGNCIVKGDSFIGGFALADGSAILSGNCQLHGGRVNSGTHEKIYSVIRSDGYHFIAWPENGDIVITAGCRHFTTMHQARDHWSKAVKLHKETGLILDYFQSLFS